MQIKHLQRENSEIILNDSPKIFFINNQDKQKFVEILKSSEISTKLAILSATDNPNPQELVTETSNILMDACSKAGIKSKKNPPTSGRQEPWYDHECRKIKNSIKKKCKKIRKRNDNENLQREILAEINY